MIRFRVCASSGATSELNDKEVFLLLVGAYCHDLGMFLGGHQNESPQEIRLHHHERSAGLIESLVTGHYINLDTFEVTVAKIIARAHRSVDIDEVPAEHNAEQSVIRTRLLSALLRIADACDLDHTRAPEAVFNFLFNSIPESSKQHWRRHITIRIKIPKVEKRSGLHTITSLPLSFPTRVFRLREEVTV